MTRDFLFFFSFFLQPVQPIELEHTASLYLASGPSVRQWSWRTAITSHHRNYHKKFFSGFGGYLKPECIATHIFTKHQLNEERQFPYVATLSRVHLV